MKGPGAEDGLGLPPGGLKRPSWVLPIRLAKREIDVRCSSVHSSGRRCESRRRLVASAADKSSVADLDSYGQLLVLLHY